MMKQSEIVTYNIQNERVELELAEGVFSPSDFGSFLAEHIVVRPGESVLDIGTGGGFLAILASKWGGTVTGTDTDPEAIALAEKNAERNGVDIALRVSDLFAEVTGTFDVIIANLPQKMILDFQDDVGVLGGESGNEILLRFLREVTEYMHEGTRVYIAVYTLANHIETLQYVTEHFSAKLLALQWVPDEIIERTPDQYQELDAQGAVDISQRGSQQGAYEYVLELSQK